MANFSWVYNIVTAWVKDEEIDPDELTAMEVLDRFKGFQPSDAFKQEFTNKWTNFVYNYGVWTAQHYEAKAMSDQVADYDGLQEHLKDHMEAPTPFPEDNGIMMNWFDSDAPSAFIRLT